MKKLLAVFLLFPALTFASPTTSLSLLVQGVRLYFHITTKEIHIVSQGTGSSREEAVKKALESAVANAENNHQLDVDRLYVAEASVGRSIVMKRWHARGRGRSSGVQKPFSHLTIVVRERREQA